MEDFDISTLKSNANICIIGDPGTGKTTFAKYLVNKHKIDFTVYQKEITNEFDKPSQQFENSVLKRNLVNESIITLENIIILDDCVPDDSSSMNELFMNSRFFKCGVITTMTKFSLTDFLIANVDKFFVFKTSNLVDIYTKLVSSQFPTFQDFEKHFNEITSEPYTCMVIDRCCHTDYNIYMLKSVPI